MLVIVQHKKGVHGDKFRKRALSWSNLRVTEAVYKRLLAVGVVLGIEELSGIPDDPKQISDLYRDCGIDESILTRT